ncbi:hypothetical protein [Nostoc sp.]
MRLTGVADARRDGYYFMCDAPGDIGIAAVKHSPSKRERFFWVGH